ncbi:hypothetical protein QYM36_012360 [Artemia franciscana]|uniref:PPM-type phosphatase domain-containing protein n=1 Tax=Artemia franciscana TaxID=6661 RepID=A0AA88HKM6_ARTSF|nr:hypothetical protein QYM36_012360 [Artemia franciscana]
MGAYLTEPVTQKISDDETSAKKRIEDAHNVIMYFDENTSYFAVYDGHGGSEVAAYCSVNLPEFLKKLESFKRRDFEKALVAAFLVFDKTLTEPEIVKKLKKMAADDYESVEEEEDEEVSELYQEAKMSLDELLKKYKPKGKEDEPEKEDTTLPKGRIHSLKGQSKRKPSSPALRPKRPSSFTSQGDTEEGESSSGEGQTSNSEEKEEAKSKGNNEKSEAQESCKEERVEVTKVNGTLEKEKDTSSEGSDVTLPQTPSIKGKGKGKGKSIISTKTSTDIGQDEVMDLQPVVKVDKLPVRVSPRKAKELYKSITEVSNSNGNADESESDESDADLDAGKDESDHSSGDAVNEGSAVFTLYQQPLQGMQNFTEATQQKENISLADVPAYNKPNPLNMF